MFTVTLKDLRKAGACFDGYNQIVRMLQGKTFTGKDLERESYIKFGHDEPISLVDICNNNGLDDALWATRCLVGHDRDLRLFAVWCARQVQNLMKDSRSLNALDFAERFANGEATQEELDVALTAAAAAWDAAGAAAEAASVAAARAAALAVWDAARDAARSAAAAALAAGGTAGSAQKEMFVAMCEGRAPWQK